MLDDTTALADTLLALLPQTQCTKCGYPDCRSYAQAMASGEAGYNQCPPGGQEGVARLAQALQQPVIPLNPTHGVERSRPVAYIDEARCIGCTLCIQACPVDAIIGAPKQMHTVLAADCTGCDLCIAPCPVDCISLLPVTGTATGWAAWSLEQAQQARIHYARHQARQERAQKHPSSPPQLQQASMNDTPVSIPASIPISHRPPSSTDTNLPTPTKPLISDPLAQTLSRPLSQNKEALLQAILQRAAQKNQ